MKIGWEYKKVVGKVFVMQANIFAKKKIVSKQTACFLLLR